LIRIVAQAWQSLLGAIGFHPLLISPVSGDDSSIVGDVFTLRIDSIQLKANSWLGVISILLDDAASLLEISFLRVLLPPLDEISVKIELSPLVIEA
jgi:hypothetical protein